jgi:hypothetical protein
MKIYREMRDPFVLHDVAAGVWFPREREHPLHLACLAEVAAGKAVILPFEEPSPAEKRRAAYLSAGLTSEALAVALWEKIVEGRDEKADAIQVERDAIKARIPATLPAAGPK